MSRAEVNELAVKYGLDPKKYSKKEDLCDALIEVSSQKVSKATPAKATKVTPAKTSKAAPAKTSKATPAKTSKAAPPKQISPRLSDDDEEIEINNQYIANKLREAASYHETKGDAYRANALRNSANIVEKFPVPIVSPKVQLLGVSGVGQGTIDRITEILSTGDLSELSGTSPERKFLVSTPTKSKEVEIFDELTSVHGIGPANARELMLKGVTGIDDLIDKYNQGKINLNEAQIIGLTYHQQFNEKIPRDEVETFGNWIIEAGKDLDENFMGEIVGSYRRGKRESGDIDILISDEKGQNYLKDLVQLLVDHGFIKHTLSHGPVKFQGTYFSNYPDEDEDQGILRKIDIRFVPRESWGTALLHATGSGDFNKELRTLAQKKNMKLSEHALTKMIFDPRTKETTETIIPIQKEIDVFNALDLPYITPDQRESGVLNLE
jgi:DNA polymerase/3'-5' exonuclease PolX